VSIVHPPRRIAVLISGAGSNMLALLDACARGDIDGDVVTVLSDQPQAAGLSKAAARGVPVQAIPFEPGESRYEHDLRLRQAIEERDAELVVLAGYMRILDTQFVQHFASRMLNIHPSLLPRHKGLHTHRRVLEAGDPIHGASVHYVTPELDGGPCVLQGYLAVRTDDDAESLRLAVHRIEHVIYPRVVGWATAGRLAILDGIPTFDGLALQQPLREEFARS
jgi:phosphoribosylglycinamide formyltransferase-1